MIFSLQDPYSFGRIREKSMVVFLVFLLLVLLME
jgi:hypothetical protein